MALWSHAARSALPGRMMIAAITIFGALRFAARALANTVRTPRTRWGWAWLGCFVVAAAWSSFYPYAPTFTTAFDFSARCLGVTSAVLTGDFMMGRRRLEQVKRVDWVGSFAFLAGLAMPLYVPHGPMELTPDPWWHPWLLPSYLAALLVCVCGRAAQRIGIVERLVKARRQ
jgi:hypothetical protein